MVALIPRRAGSSQAPRPVRRGVGGAALALAALAAAACEGPPARAKPWRHVVDPEPGAGIDPAGGWSSRRVDSAGGSAPSAEGAATSALLRDEQDRARALAGRSTTLGIQVDADPRHLNPLVDPSIWTQRIAVGTVFETPLRCATDAVGATRYQAGLAVRWSVPTTGADVALELEPDATFHDGSRLAAIDVQFSLDAARGPRGPAHLRALLADVASVELAGPRGVRLWLRRPSGYVLRALCEVPVLPAAIYRRDLAGSARPGGPTVGSGPYRLEAWDEPTIRLARDPAYRGPAPAIEHLVFRIEPDDARAMTMARTGELDVLPALIPAHAAAARDPAVTRGFAPVAIGAAAFDYVAVNAGRPPLDDVRVRRAISLALDRARWVASARGGLGRPIAAPVWPGGPASGAAPAAPAFDPAAAARLLDEAGWSDRDGDGLREQGGERLQVVALISDQPNPARDAALEAIRALGVFVDTRVGSPAVLMNRLQGGQFQLAFVAWRGQADGDLEPLVGTGGAQNYGRASDAEVDRLLAAMRATWDPAERFRLAGALGARLAETLPLIPLWSEEPIALVHRRVRGASPWNGWLPLSGLSLAPDDAAE